MEQGKGGRTDMRQGVMGQWEQERTREMGAAPSSTPMLAMCQLTAGCAVSREVNQPESLLTQWGRQMCSLHLWKASQRRRHLRAPERMSSHW